MAGLYAPAEPIAATPAAHSITTGAQLQTGPDRWEVGYSQCPENCVDVATWDPDCRNWPGGVKPEKSDAPENEACYDVDPFVIETAFGCDAKGWSTINFAGRARRQLEAATPKALEYELWTGTLKADNPNLQTGATVIGSGGYSPKLGLALLGMALADCYHGGVGVIHAPSWIVDIWLEYGTIKENGNRLITIVRGDTVIAGSGYPGTGPDGAGIPDNHAWVFATGPVQYRLGDTIVFPDTFEEAFDKKRNRVEYRAERMAAINFDPCCHFAVLINAEVEGSEEIS